MLSVFVLAFALNVHASPQLENVIDVSVGDDHACALTERGVTCWGDNGDKQLDVPEFAFKKIAAGSRYTCGITTDDEVKCWGFLVYPPVRLTGVDELVTGGDAYCVRFRGTKERACWGTDAAIPGQFNTVDIFATSGLTSCGYNSPLFPNTVRCWGNQDWQLNRRMPSRFGQVKALAVGEVHACALDNMGVVCWHNGEYPEAAEVPKDLGPVDEVIAGVYHTCARSQNRVRCWGQSGTGHRTENNVVAIRGSLYSSCAIINHGSRNGVKCWGGSEKIKNQIPTQLR